MKEMEINSVYMDEAKEINKVLYDSLVDILGKGRIMAEDITKVQKDFMSKECPKDYIGVGSSNRDYTLLQNLFYVAMGIERRENGGPSIFRK